MRSQLGIQSVLGALYASVTFLSIINSIVLQPIVSENRSVMYRERAAGGLKRFGTLSCNISESGIWDVNDHKLV